PTPRQIYPLSLHDALPISMRSTRCRFGIPSWFRLLLSNRFALVGCIMLLLIVLAAVFAPLLTSYDPSNMADMPSLSPSPDHFFGDRKSTRLNSSHVKISYA